jgi:DnaJ-class molecular chaperone
MAKCVLCSGRGVWFFGTRKCPDCDGAGQVPPEKHHAQVIRKNRAIESVDDARQSQKARN